VLPARPSCVASALCMYVYIYMYMYSTDKKKTDGTTGDVPRFGAIVSNMGARKEMVKASLFGGGGGDV